MTDTELKQHVQNALDWEPSIDASDIGVSVDQSVVTLRGNVGSYVEKVSAEWNTVVPADPVTVTVANGWMTQAPTTTSIRTSDVAAAIEAAFRRSAETERAVAAFERPQNRKRS